MNPISSSNLLNNGQINTEENQLNIHDTAYKLIHFLKNEIKNGIDIVKKHVAQGIAGDLVKLEKVSQLLNSPLIEEYNLQIINEVKNERNRSYTLVCDDLYIFTIYNIVDKNLFTTYYTCRITLEAYFHELYRIYNKYYLDEYFISDYNFDSNFDSDSGPDSDSNSNSEHNTYLVNSSYT